MRIKTIYDIKVFCLIICFVLLSYISSFSENITKSDNTYREIDEQIFGAKPDDRGPIGGGVGYKKSIIDGNYNIKDIDGLLDALNKVKAGEIIFLDRNTEIDCTDLVFTEGFQIKVPAGVILASDRGYNGSEGAILKSENFATNPLINVLGPNARITGLRILGPDPKPRVEHHKRSFTAGKGDRQGQSRYYYLFPNSAGITTVHDALEVDNCELIGWSHAAIYLKTGKDHRIHHNYIHHNQRQGLGYGICLGSESGGLFASALIEYNLFDYNRHSIAGTGSPGEAYEASNNIELNNSLSHIFDMHSGKDRRDGSDIAGELILIHHNTFMNPKVLAIAIRGIPSDKAVIYNNWFAQEKPGPSVILPWPISEKDRVRLFNNLFGKENPAVR